MLDSYKTEAAKAELLKKSECVRNNTDQLDKLIVRQLEYTRKQYGFTQQYYSSLLGVDFSFYSKLSLGQRQPTITILVRYCQIFGLDISGLVAEEYLNSSDTVLRELAMYMSLLSSKTISSMADALEGSEESSRTKERGKLLFERLQTMEDKPRPFFIKDVSLDAVPNEENSGS